MRIPASFRVLLCEKTSKAIGILYRLKTIYPQLVLQTLYNTLILPYFNYCILVWGATINEGNPLHLLQIPCSFMVESSRVESRTVLPIVINKFKPKYAEQKLLGLH